jgi:hypothetical protein
VTQVRNASYKIPKPSLDKQVRNPLHRVVLQMGKTFWLKEIYITESKDIQILAKSIPMVQRNSEPDGSLNPFWTMEIVYLQIHSTYH